MSASAASAQSTLFTDDRRSAARPFLKWAGGKTRLLPSLLPHVPDQFGRYHEPFLGGGAVLFAVGSRAAAGAFVSDLNAELVNAWQVVQSRPTDVHEALKGYEARDSEAFYYEVRAERFTNPLDRAAHFLYLNRTSWNGLYRVNRWGQFNVPWGARKFHSPSLESLQAASSSLRDVTVGLSDFREALDRTAPGDFVYLDPPYLRISDTSKFNGYTERRFRLDDLIDLSERLKSLTTRGVVWLLSNRDSDEMRELFAGNTFTPLTVRRAVAAQNRRAVEAADSPEVIVSNAQLIS
jgi:DNA adenine methylase